MDLLLRGRKMVLVPALFPHFTWPLDKEKTMNRVCLTKDGKLIEMQSGGDSDAHLDTLKQNALNAGYKKDEIEVKWVTDEAWAVIQTGLNKPTPEQIAETEKESLVQTKTRELAIMALKTEGKLDKDGKITKKGI